LGCYLELTLSSALLRLLLLLRRQGVLTDAGDAGAILGRTSRVRTLGRTSSAL